MFGPDKPVITKEDAKAILARSAVVGFGRSAGRDIYRISTNPYVIWAAIAFGGAGYVVYDMQCAKKHDPKTIKRIAVGSILATYVAVSIVSGSTPIAVVGTLLIQGISAFIGQRMADERWGPLEHAREIEAANVAFLDKEGFRDVGGRMGTVIDRYGNELIPDDQRSDAFVFRIIGRRSVRAYIRLDDEGRMLTYEPPPGTRPLREEASAARQVQSDDEPDDVGSSYPLNEKQAADLLSRLNSKAYLVLEEIMQQARDEHAGLLWEELQEITGYQSWSDFVRSVRRPIDRELQNITGDKCAQLLIDSDDLGREESERRYIFIEGPAVSSLQKAFMSSGAQQVKKAPE